MQYINVSQFYETVLCFAIPLLLIQRMLLYCTGLSEKYEKFRINFYEAQFEITHQYQNMPQQQKNKDQEHTDQNKQTPKEQGLRSSMLEDEKTQRRNSLGEIIQDNLKQQQKQDSSRFSRTSSYRSTKKQDNNGLKRKSYADLDLQSDKQFKVDPRVLQRKKKKSITKDEEQIKSQIQMDQIKTETVNYPEINQKQKQQQNKDEAQKQQAKVQIKQETQQNKQGNQKKQQQQDQGNAKQQQISNEDVQNPYTEQQKIQQRRQSQTKSHKQSISSSSSNRNSQKKSQHNVSVSSSPKNKKQSSQLQQSQLQIKKQNQLQENKSNHPDKISQIQQEERRQTQLDRENLAISPQNCQQLKPHQQIQISPHQIQERQIIQRRRLKYCRRIDQAFSQYVPIIFSMVVLGILTRSVYIFSMCCFFGYAFTSLLFNYGQLLDRLEDASAKQSLFGKVNKLLAGIFILALFLSYWIDNQFAY